jgi:outer membrane immunogenic protein
MIYGTGGVAWSRIDHSFAASNAVNTFVEADDIAWGYQLGGGAAFKLRRLTLGGEYLWTTLMDEDRYTVRARGPAPATNPFILTNGSGTDLQRADRLEFGVSPQGCASESGPPRSVASVQ